MKGKVFLRDSLSMILLAAASILFSVLTLSYNTTLAVFEIAVTLVIIAAALIRILFRRRRYKKFLIRVSEKLDYTNRKVLSSFPYPAAVCTEDGTVSWCSDTFISEIARDELKPNTNINSFSGGALLTDTEGENSVAINDRFYTVNSIPFLNDGINYRVFFFIDNTRLKSIETEYIKTRPYVILIELDNLDDSRTGFKDSERAEIKGRIEAMMDEWAEKYSSFIKRISNDRYIIVTEKENVESMTEDKFSVIENVRNFYFKDKDAEVTLSMGVACGENIFTGQKEAKKALNLALGRGGDQVAIKDGDRYEFIGGVVKSAEKKYRAKTRLIGTAAAQMIIQSSGVFICGHTAGDLDSFGSSVGMAYAASKLNVPAFIVTNRDKSLAGPLLDMITSGESDIRIIDSARAEQLMNRRSLFVLTDTHMPNMCEYPELFAKAEKRIVIDHHRRTPKSDETVADLFYQDANASSSCEMVTELLPYMLNDDGIPKPVAEALLAGITLDTKNFVVGAGVRTFEAAALLKDKGADTVEVKKLFAGTLEESRAKYGIISSAEEHKGCAISIVGENVANARLVAAQAADEMLNIRGIAASFVIFRENDSVCVSARSYGEINVQLIMEALGGGGHRTMAATRIQNVAAEEIRKKIKNEIDSIRKEV